MIKDEQLRDWETLLGHISSRDELEMEELALDAVPQLIAEVRRLRQWKLLIEQTTTCSGPQRTMTVTVPHDDGVVTKYRLSGHVFAVWDE